MSKIIELKTRGIRPRLREAMESKQLVRVWRDKLEPGSFSGFVCAVGPEYFVLWVVGEYIGFDGLYALRHRDVSDLETPDSNLNFITKALAWRGIVPELPNDIPLDNIEQLFAHITSHNKILSLHLDSEGMPEVCYVGRFVDFEHDGFRLQEINPDAEWMTELSTFGFEEVSAIAWQTPYNQALEHIADAPPDLRPSGFGHSGV